MLRNRRGEPIGTEEAIALFGSDRSVGRDVLVVDGEEVLVSTVFLVVDHSLDPDRPQIFETMVFGGPLDGECWRYANEPAALAGHDQVVATLKGEHGAGRPGDPWTESNA